MVAVPSVRIGAPVEANRLTVFPLYLESSAKTAYRLADEALADGSVVVEEVSESGSVPQLAVRNANPTPVLFLEGQELRGAKQNRVLNASVLIAAGARTVLPVSCVEQGRWRHMSKHFAASEYHSSPKLRGVLKRSVSASARRGDGHSSDQGAVWAEVSRQMESLGGESVTMAMSDTYTARKSDTDKTLALAAYPEGASGLAVALGGKVVAVDLFDAPETCQKVWSRLLSGVAMDALEETEARPAAENDVNAALNAMNSASWRTVPPAGIGEEHRTEAGGGWHGSLLTLEGSLIHGSLVAG